MTNVAGQTAVKLEELDHAEQLADSLQYAVATKEHSAATITQAAELRQQVYTLTLNAYDDARRAVIFLRWNDNDADDITPSLFAGKKQRAHNGEEEPADPAATQPAPGTEVTRPASPGPGQPAGAQGGATPVIPPGMPGASPFTNS